MTVDTVLSLLMFAAMALVASAVWQWRRNGFRRQVWLQLLLAAVMIVNVLIWTMPYGSGTAPVDRVTGGLR
jgi:uncharacterized membrane protein